MTPMARGHRHRADPVAKESSFSSLRVDSLCGTRERAWKSACPVAVAVSVCESEGSRAGDASFRFVVIDLVRRYKHCTNTVRYPIR